MTRAQRIQQLSGLTLGHFITDMFGGFLVPLLPALVARLGTTPAVLGMVAGVVGIVVNLTQPFTGALLHRFRAPVLLWVGPLLALGFTLVGQVHTVPQLLAVTLVGSLGVGLFHPGALLGAHAVSGRQERVAVPIFLSGGAFGVAIGAVLVSQWVSRVGFDRLWWLAPAGAAFIFGVLLLGGMARVDIHHPLPKQQADAGPVLSFGAVFFLASVLATGMTMLFTYLPFHLKELFPDARAVQLGGMALGGISIGGAVSSYCWGLLSHRVSSLRLVALGQCLLIPPFLWLLSARHPWTILLVCLLCGPVSGGSFFPLVATLARRAHGLTPGLRAGLIVGGAWGVGALGTVLGAWMLDHQYTAAQVMLWVIPLSLLAAATAAVLDRKGQKLV